MPLQPPAYPNELIHTSWQKKKGLIAKIATKDDGTGIGKSLERLHTLFKAIDWQELDIAHTVPQAASKRTDADVAASKERAMKQGAAVKAAYEHARKVEIAAKNLAAEWANSKVIPKSSTAAAQEVSDKAKTLSFAIAPATISAIIDKGLKQVNDGAIAQRKAVQDTLKKIGPVIDKINGMIDKKEIRLTNWADVWKGSIRFVGTWLPDLIEANPALAGDAANWQTHSNKCRNPADQKQLDAWLVDIEKIGKSMKPKLRA